jgi:hypothetical protein
MNFGSSDGLDVRGQGLPLATLGAGGPGGAPAALPIGPLPFPAGLSVSAI